MPTLKGKCHCGNVEWTVTYPGEKVPGHALCHCGACQRLGGGEYTCNQIVHKDQVKVTKGEDQLKTYIYKGDSGNNVYCYYCSNCTTHPYHKQGEGDNLVVRSILLEGSHQLPVDIEVYGKNRAPFQPEIAKTFSQLPE